jgi:hypothetical protein
MQIKNHEFPPNIADIEKEFGSLKEKPIVFTYNDTIYNPIGFQIPADLLVHESTHAEQQDGDAETWWTHYLADKDWRIEQEAEAYGNQYRFICRTVKDRNARDKNLRIMAGFLSGPMYGSVINLQEAMKRIRMYSEGIYKIKDDII